MSLDQIYQRIPLAERICKGCGQPIQRNVIIFNGELYHWGCLKKTRALPTHRCQDCFGFMNAAGMVKVNFGNSPSYQRACGNCGSPHLRKIDRWWAEKYLQ